MEHINNIVIEPLANNNGGNNGGQNQSIQNQIPEDIVKIITERFGKEYPNGRLDENGNLINENNEILLTYEDILKKLDTDDVKEIEIDGVKYKLDKDGNALDENGNIFKKKEEVEEILNKDNIIKFLEKETNIILLDNEGKPLVFDNSLEGIVKRELAIAEQYYKMGETKAIESFFSKEPELLDLYIHLKTKGSLDSYIKPIDYSNIKLDEDNVDLHKEIIIQSQLQKGNNLEVAKKFADFAVDSKSSYELAKLALNELKETQQKEREAAINKIKEEQELEAKMIAEYRNKYESIVKSKNIKGLPILDVITVKDGDKVYTYTLQDFLDYKFKPAYKNNKTGEILTKAEYDRLQYESDIENEVLLDYLLFTKQNFSDLIKNKAEDLKIKDIKSKFEEYFKNKKSKPVQNNTSEGNNSILNINIK